MDQPEPQDASRLCLAETLDEAGRVEVAIPDEDPLAAEGFRVQPTDLGLVSPTMQLGDTPEETREIWAKLPPLYWLYESSRLKPAARVWADFCAQRTDFTIGRFMKKYVWPGPITYVNPARLVRALLGAGFNVHELRDDTRHYACTVRDWGDALEAQRTALAARFGEPAVRAFLLFLRGSLHFLETNRTQAYHLVAGREAAPLASGRA